MEDDVAGVVTPAVGDLLADRYSLSAHINDDTDSRQVWRGMDILLNRPVTVVLRSPGGETAEEMLSAAVAASRVNHPNIVGVYDAVDQGDCAYVVREWVDGQSLREAVEATALPTDHAVDLIQCIADAVAAVHETGAAHGGIHPSAVLLSTDDRVVLTDPRSDTVATEVGDVRALGATLYYSLTGGWPRIVPGPESLPDAPTDSAGHPLAPSAIRDDVPANLDALVQNLLATDVAPPTAAKLAEELGDIVAEPDDGALSLVTEKQPAASREEPEEPAEAGPTGPRRLMLGAGALLGLAVIGLIAALIVIPSDSGDEEASQEKGVENEDANEQENAPEELKLDDQTIQIIDPDNDTSAPQNLAHLVDGKPDTQWNTQWYYQSNWGGYRTGMGILLDLGEARQVAKIQMDMPHAGNTVAVYAADENIGSNPDVETLDVIAEPIANDEQALNLTASPDVAETQHVLIWCTEPAPIDDGKFQWIINDITVYAH